MKLIHMIEYLALIIFAMVAGAGCCYRILADTGQLLRDERTSPAVASVEINTVPPEVVYAFMAEPQTEPQPETEIETAPEPLYDIPLDAALQHGIKELCNRYEISFELILAVIMTESSGNAEVIGDGGASAGLMQVQARWWQWLADENGLDLNEPLDNVECGILIVLLLLEENDGQMDKALTAYNCGNPDNEENMYFETVLSWLDKLEELERGAEHDG